jgi:hypothetical protein
LFAAARSGDGFSIPNIAVVGGVLKGALLRSNQGELRIGGALGSLEGSSERA